MIVNQVIGWLHIIIFYHVRFMQYIPPRSSSRMIRNISRSSEKSLDLNKNSRLAQTVVDGSIIAFQSSCKMIATTFVNGSRKRSHSVRFPESPSDLQQVVAEVVSCFDFSDEDKKALWFTRDDYKFSKSSARVLAKESERYGHSKHLDGAYDGNYNPQLQNSLNLWVLHGANRRGLERWANTTLGLSQKEDQYLYIQGVLRAQREMKLKTGCVDQERLREVGHHLSRKSRLYAHMMGEADSYSAKWEFGMIDARQRVSPRLHARKNLGLSGPASSSVRRGTRAAAPPAGRRPTQQPVISPKISIRTRPGRVPHIA